MPNVLLQTLIRETNLWGYRPYPRNVIEHVVERVDIDVGRCFSFLNDVRNMRAVAETVLARGRLFQPTISFTAADWATDEYYLGVVRDIIALCGGTDEIVLCLKDMAGVGSITRIGRLVDRIKQKHPDLVLGYHRHITDCLAMPSLLAAAKAGAQILDRRGGLALALLRPLADPRGPGVPRGVGRAGPPRAPRGGGCGAEPAAPA